MAISLLCPSCKSCLDIKAKACQKCGHHFTQGRMYRVRVKAGGKWHSKCVDTLQQAKQIEGVWRGQKAMEGIIPERKAMPTLGEIWALFDRQDNSRLKDPTSWRRRWEHHVGPEFGNTRLDQITAQEMRLFLGKLHEKQAKLSHNATGPERKVLSQATVNMCVKLIGRLFNYASANGLWSGENPIRRVKLPRFNNEVTRSLDGQQLGTFLDVLNGLSNRAVALAFKFCLATGKRAGEVFKLTWAQVDFSAKVIEFTVKSTTLEKSQKLPMSAVAQAILYEAFLMRLDDCPYVFHTRNGRAFVHGSYWAKVRKAAQLPSDFRVHDLRHTFASHLASSGKVDIYTLQNLLGHGSISMTKRYAHLVDERLRQSLAVADEIFS